MLERFLSTVVVRSRPLVHSNDVSSSIIEVHICLTSELQPVDASVIHSLYQMERRTAVVGVTALVMIMVTLLFPKWRSVGINTGEHER